MMVYFFFHYLFIFFFEVFVHSWLNMASERWTKQVVMHYDISA